MRAIYLYVTGNLSDTPSTTRGFTALAYDIVDWWNARTSKCVRTSDFVELRAHIIAALRGQNDGALRPIRPSHRRGTHISLDDLRTILLSPEPTSAKIQRIHRRLIKYQRKGLIASPVVDAPAALHIFRCDSIQTLESAVIPIRTGASEAMKELGRELMSLAMRCDDVETVVFFDEVQAQYISAMAGSNVVAGMCPDAPRLRLRRFIAKEKLGPGMPLQMLAKRMFGGPVEPGANLAGEMARISSKLGIPDLIPGLCKACNVTVQEAIERGIRFRCVRLVSLQTGDVPRDRQKQSRVEAKDFVEGGHVIDPACTLVSRALAIVDFASLYPSIIAAKRVGDHIGLPDIVIDLMQRRRSCNDKGLARACKLVANSLYGQLASPTSPVFDSAAANAITSAGRAYLQDLVEHLNQRGGRVVYGDTDSCMVVFEDGPSPETCKHKVEECIASFNASLPDPMNVTVQEIFARSVFLSKKKYIGVGCDGSMHFIGTYNRRSDSPPIGCMEYEKLAHTLFQDDCSEKDIVGLLASARERFGKADANAFSAMRKLTSMPKGAERSAAAPPHIDLACRENYREDGFAYTDQDSIEYVQCVPEPTHSSDGRRAHPVFGGVDRTAATSIDRESVWKTFSSAAGSLISAVIGPEVADAAVRACVHHEY